MENTLIFCKKTNTYDCHIDRRGLHKPFEEIILKRETVLLEILGKPITLSVLCLALENNRIEVSLTIYSDKMHIGHFDQPHQRGNYTHGYWNLSKDNFNDQSEETKTFIGELLK